MPAAYFLDFPAKLNVSGNNEDVPKPTSPKPKKAIQKVGNRTASKIPTAITEPLNK